MVSLYFENFLTNSSYNKYFLLSRGFFKKALYSSRWLKWNFKNNLFGSVGGNGKPSPKINSVWFLRATSSNNSSLKAPQMFWVIILVV